VHTETCLTWSCDQHHGHCFVDREGNGTTYQACDDACVPPPPPMFEYDAERHMCVESKTSTANFTTCSEGCDQFVCDRERKRCYPDFHHDTHAHNYTTCTADCK
jgi:hypothetical protein